jgi:hypothetical protein
MGLLACGNLVLWPARCQGVEPCQHGLREDVAQQFSDTCGTSSLAKVMLEHRRQPVHTAMGWVRRRPGRLLCSLELPATSMYTHRAPRTAHRAPRTVHRTPYSALHTTHLTLHTTHRTAHRTAQPFVAARHAFHIAPNTCPCALHTTCGQSTLRCTHFTAHRPTLHNVWHVSACYGTCWRRALAEGVCCEPFLLGGAEGPPARRELVPSLTTKRACSWVWVDRRTRGCVCRCCLILVSSPHRDVACMQHGTGLPHAPHPVVIVTRTRCRS